MPQRLLTLTFWPTLTDTKHPAEHTMSWEGALAEVFVHKPYAAKDEAPGFGPYRLSRPERKDDAVEALTCLVYDADQGTAAQIEDCRKALDQAGLAYKFYSTWSWDPAAERQAYRLVLPLSRDVSPEEFDSLRRSVLEEFAVPAVANQCSGKSHFYYLPSYPAIGGQGCREMWSARLFLRPDDFELTRTAARRRIELPDWSPPEEPAKFRMLPKVNKLRDYAADNRNTRLGDLVERVLLGRHLAEHGNRTVAMRDLTNLLVYLFPKASVGVVMALIRGSLDSMQEAGSKLSDARVERMILSAMRKKAEAEVGQAAENTEARSLLFERCDEV